ncbi:MAG: hypothetical protein KA430_09255 [Bacteroidia bacterium]|nr:hypothetical protein [Bacteroidia bacterium]MBP6657586.1 hypothetical protein [Bacteroidia bacterium]
MKGLTLLIIVFASLFVSCKKENDNPQWNVNFLGPLAKATLGIENLIGDSSLSINSNGAVSLIIDTTFSNFKLDSIYTIPDTTILTTQIFPPAPFPIPPGTVFTPGNSNVVLGVSGVQLKSANLQEGSIKIEIKNTLQSKILYTYKIPRAIKNGVPFEVNFTIDSASITDPKFFTQSYDFSGYTIDLTGSTGGSFNTLAYDVLAKSDPAGDTFNLAGSDTLINIKTSLLGIAPNYVRGYLGQTDLSENKSISFGFGNLISDGTIALDSVDMKFEVTNYIGVDIQAYINSLTSVNNRTGQTVPLNNSNLIQHNLNINRATENSLASYNVIPYVYSVSLNKNNSNIKQIMESLPDSLRYDLSFQLNPLGNISGSSDFIYSDKLIDTRIQVKMPLSFAANQLTLSDTIDFNIEDATDLDPIGPSVITLHAMNGFPFDMNMQLLLLDENNNVIDSLLVPGLIASGQLDINNLVTSSTQTKIPIPIDDNRKQKLTNTKRIKVRAAFTTPNYPQLVQLYNSYHLDLKFIGDGEYLIR